MCRIFPLTVGPDRVTLLETITLIWLGSVVGGAELSPVVAVQVDPHVSAVGLLAKPFIGDGAVPLLKRLFLAHLAPQKLTASPTVGCPAETSPTTEAPVAVGANTDMLEDPVAGWWNVSPA
jgi:hypothetical protein